VIREESPNKLYERLKSDVATASVETSALEAEVAYLEKTIRECQGQIETLEDQMGQAEVTLARLDREIANLSDSLKWLAQQLPAARLAKAQQESFVRVVEVPVEPRVPVGPPRFKIVGLSGALAFVCGMALALGVGVYRLTSSDGASDIQKRTP